MGKKPEYILEYVYTSSQFKKKMWWCFSIWIALRILRAILIITVGLAWLGSIPAAFIFFGSGFVLGIMAHSIWRYRNSVRLEDLESERARLRLKK